MSFLARHRTICAALTELRLKLRARGQDDCVIIVEECLGYAKSMSNKLSQYKTATIAPRPASHAVDPVALDDGQRKTP
jgi:hypothetical protein